MAVLWDANLSQMATSHPLPQRDLCAEKHFLCPPPLLLRTSPHLGIAELLCTSGLLSGLLLKEWGELGRSLRGSGGWEGDARARRRPWEP